MDPQLLQGLPQTLTSDPYDTNKEDIEKIQTNDNFESETELLEVIKKCENSCLSYFNELNKAADNNRKYYGGKQIDEQNLYVGESRVFVNRILQSVETIIPMATEKTPEAVVTITPSTKDNKNLEDIIEKKMKNLWEVELDMQSEMEEGLRNLFCAKYMLVKMDFDVEGNEITCKLMPTKKVAFPKGYSNWKDLPFIIEYVEDTIKELKRKFPDKEQEIDEKIKGNDPQMSEDSLVKYIEIWKDDWYACKFKDVLLGYYRNPHYNFDDPSANFFSGPRKPYIGLNYLNFGDSNVDETSLIEQVVPLQDNLNKRKRQIDSNADGANGIMAVAGTAMPKSEAQNWANTPRGILYLSGASSVNGMVQKIVGGSIGPEVVEDMQDTKQEIDNIMGTHSTTRGEKTTQETALGRQILISRDVGRLGALYRRIERFAQEFYEYCMQMMYIYYTQPHPVHSYFKDKNQAQKGRQGILTDLQKMDYIVNTEFKDKKVYVLVQQGSATPKDKVNQQADAVELAKAGMMAVVDMYRILEYSNPEQYAKNALMEKLDPTYLFPEIQNPDEYDLQAIQDLFKIAQNDPEMPLDLDYQFPDIQMLEQYLKTLYDYRKGETVHPDLPTYLNLSFQNKLNIENLQKKVMMRLQALISMEQTRMIQQKQQAFQQQNDQSQGKPIRKDRYSAALQGGATVRNLQAPMVGPNTQSQGGPNPASSMNMANNDQSQIASQLPPSGTQ